MFRNVTHDVIVRLECNALEMVLDFGRFHLSRIAVQRHFVICDGRVRDADWACINVTHCAHVQKVSDIIQGAEDRHGRFLVLHLLADLAKLGIDGPSRIFQGMHAEWIVRDLWSSIAPNDIHQVLFDGFHIAKYEFIIIEFVLGGTRKGFLQILDEGGRMDEPIHADRELLRGVLVLLRGKLGQEFWNGRRGGNASLLQRPAFGIELHGCLVPVPRIRPDVGGIMRDEGGTCGSAKPTDKLASHVGVRDVFTQMRIIARDEIRIQTQLLHLGSQCIQLLLRRHGWHCRCSCGFRAGCFCFRRRRAHQGCKETALVVVLVVVVSGAHS
mmetsp:Transcript_27411/g.76870  ORF Transcript_27411/g.76870 Transcript_27411/m.76870 type:complete len:327 (+) Transcript_27411:1150-2130(+)